MSSDLRSTPPARFEFTGAFLLLRLFLGLRLLLAGLEKFESKGTYSLANYSTNMSKMSEGITSASFLPLWMTRGFAHSLGYALLVVGAAVLLGLKTRVALLLAGLLFVGLAFGLMAVQENEGVAWLGLHVGLCAAALVLAQYNRFALWADRRD
jgi:thiosulfate dehydrogenase [quinone] large subunit